MLAYSIIMLSVTPKIIEILALRKVRSNTSSGLLNLTNFLNQFFSFYLPCS